MNKKYNTYNPTLGEQAADEFNAGLDDQKSPNRFIEHNYKRYKALFDIAQKSAALAGEASKELETIPTVEDQMDALDSWQDYATLEEFKEASNIGGTMELAPQAIRSVSDAEVAKTALLSHLEETRAHLLLDDKTMNRMHAGALKENEKIDRAEAKAKAKIDKAQAKEERKRSKELAPSRAEQEFLQAKQDYDDRRAAIFETALRVAPFFPSTLDQYEELRATVTDKWNDLVPDRAQLNSALDDILSRKGKTNSDTSPYGDYYDIRTYEEFQNGESALKLERNNRNGSIKTFISRKGDGKFWYSQTGKDFIALNIYSGLDIAQGAAESLLPERPPERSADPRRDASTSREINRNAKKLTEILRGKIQELDSVNPEKIAFGMAQRLLAAGDTLSKDLDEEVRVLPQVLEVLRTNDTVREAYKRTSGKEIDSDISAQHIAT